MSTKRPNSNRFYFKMIGQNDFQFNKLKIFVVKVQNDLTINVFDLQIVQIKIYYNNQIDKNITKIGILVVSHTFNSKSFFK